MKKQNWLIPLILTVAGGAALLQSRSAPAPAESAPSVESAPTGETSSPPAGETCAYVWATKDAPELSEMFSARVRELRADAQASASFFGENCAYADGRSEFLARETDFYVRLPVSDLTDEEGMGNWIARVMPLVLEIPPEAMRGSGGFVEFWFEKSESESVVARVPIQRYASEAQGKSGAELYGMFAAR